jgi:hypothetical protein
MRTVALMAALALHAAPLLLLRDNQQLAEPVKPLRASTSNIPLRVQFLHVDSRDGIKLMSATAFELDPQQQLTIEVPLPSFEALLADSFEESQPILNSTNEQEAERLQGIYKGQIFARLERALAELPGASGNIGRCLINIIQDDQGGVVDVLTDECEASHEWKERISKAVRLGSPLPLPPQGLAMGSYLSIDFSTARPSLSSPGRDEV